MKNVAQREGDGGTRRIEFDAVLRRGQRKAADQKEKKNSFHKCTLSGSKQDGGPGAASSAG